jgi:hypothetical protein
VAPHQPPASSRDCHGYPNPFCTARSRSSRTGRRWPPLRGATDCSGCDDTPTFHRRKNRRRKHRGLIRLGQSALPRQPAAREQLGRGQPPVETTSGREAFEIDVCSIIRALSSPCRHIEQSGPRKGYGWSPILGHDHRRIRGALADGCFNSYDLALQVTRDVGDGSALRDDYPVGGLSMNVLKAAFKTRGLPAEAGGAHPTCLGRPGAVRFTTSTDALVTTLRPSSPRVTPYHEHEFALVNNSNV